MENDARKSCWVQAAIDVIDIELAKKIAFMALDAGAEWLEVGTPLLYQYGHAAIGMIRKAVGKNVVLVADYKTPIARLCAEQAAREGADYLLLTSGYSDWATKDSIEFSRHVGIETIFMPAVRSDDLCAEAKKLVSFGATRLFTYHYAQQYGGEPDVLIDNITAIREACGDVLLGVTSDNLEEAQHAAKNGADWITFGVVLRNPEPVACKQWIDAIHLAGAR